MEIKDRRLQDRFLKILKLRTDDFRADFLKDKNYGPSTSGPISYNIEIKDQRLHDRFLKQTEIQDRRLQGRFL